MTQPIRLGIAGLGTVGAGVAKILRDQAQTISARAGCPVTISAVSARNRSKDRGVDLSAFDWEDDAVALARRDDVDLLVELIGGSDGPAKAATEAAIAAGKHVVTANKAMLAIHGQALAEAAEAAQVALMFEAAVAGGIPCVKALTEGLAGNRITRVMGVMNGTCNYILTRMESAGLSYTDVFQEASDLGYLEADPTLDVGGVDAGHKLALLAAIAFGARVDFEGVRVQGIEAVSIDDIRQAADMGFRIKLLGVAQAGEDGIEARMTPCLVPAASPLGTLEGPTNMVVFEGDAVGRIIMSGAGAGEGPTASAVWSDIIDIARGFRRPVFGRPAKDLARAVAAKASSPAPFYLRMTLRDEPGALAQVSAKLGEAGVSIDRMRQYGHEGSKAPVLIVTHETDPAALEIAVAALAQTGVVEGAPVALRIEMV